MAGPAGMVELCMTEREQIASLTALSANVAGEQAHGQVNRDARFIAGITPPLGRADSTLARRVDDAGRAHDTVHVR